MTSSKVRRMSSIIASRPPGSRSSDPLPRTGRGSLESTSRPSAWASRLAGSMVSTQVRRPCCAPRSATAAAVEVLPTPPEPQHTTMLAEPTIASSGEASRAVTAAPRPRPGPACCCRPWSCRVWTRPRSRRPWSCRLRGPAAGAAGEPVGGHPVGAHGAHRQLRGPQRPGRLDRLGHRQLLGQAGEHHRGPRGVVEQVLDPVGLVADRADARQLGDRLRRAQEGHHPAGGRSVEHHQVVDAPVAGATGRGLPDLADQQDVAEPRGGRGDEGGEPRPRQQPRQRREPVAAQVLAKRGLRVHGQAVDPFAQLDLLVADGAAAERHRQALAALDLHHQRAPSALSRRHGEGGRDRGLPGPALAGHHQELRPVEHVEGHKETIVAGPFPRSLVRVVGPLGRGDNGPAMHRFLRLLSLPCLGALIALVATLGVTSPAKAQAQAPGGPTIEVFTLSGVLDQSLLGDLRGAVAGAERRGARALLIQLDAFGGLGTDPAEVQRVVADAKVPVAIWVGPRAAQAAGASLFLLAKADVVSSSRQARIGPALPAELGRGRDADAEASLFASSGLPAEVEHGTVDGARAQSLRLTAYQAESLPDAVRQLNGRQADGHAIEVSGFQVRFLSSSLFDRVRHGLANPTLVYSLVVLPTNWLALAVLVAGTIAFTADTARGGLGALTALATALTGVGSWWLFSSPSALLRVDGRLAVLGTLWSVSWFVVILTMLLRSQRQAPTGTQALVGARGVVRSVLNPGGIVVIEGAMWRADLSGGGMLPTGQRVHVDAVENGILQVTPEDPAAVRPARRRLRPARPAPRA